MNLYLDIFADFSQNYNFDDKLDYYRNCTPHVLKTYAILFTPRSGSTLLTKKIGEYDVMSYPDEYFNPLTLKTSLNFNPSKTIIEYRNFVMNKTVSSLKIFGFEIAASHLEIISNLVAIRDLMIGEKYFIYLSRKDIVSQSISLYHAIETGVYHVNESTNKEKQDIKIEYNSSKIKNILISLLREEYFIHKFIEREKIEVLKIYYEDICEDCDLVIKNIADYINLKSPLKKTINNTSIIKANTKIKHDFVLRFRNEYAVFCENIESVRMRGLPQKGGPVES